MKLIMVVAIFGAIACATQALSPPLAVPDYISELPQLPHCMDATFKNVGTFSVSRVRCGCDDDEEKVGKHLGHTYFGPWKVQVYSAYCVPEGTAKEPIMCNQMMPLKCAKPGLSGPSKCGACGCDCTFVNGVAKKLPTRPRLRHTPRKKKINYDELEDEQIGWRPTMYNQPGKHGILSGYDEMDNEVGLQNTPSSNACYSGIGPGCLYNPYKENKYGDPNRVRTRYYAGQYYGRFDEEGGKTVWGLHCSIDMTGLRHCRRARVPAPKPQSFCYIPRPLPPHNGWMLATCDVVAINCKRTDRKGLAHQKARRQRKGDKVYLCEERNKSLDEADDMVGNYSPGANQNYWNRL